MVPATLALNSIVRWHLLTLLHSKSYSQLSSQQQCGVPFRQVSSFSAIATMQWWLPKHGCDPKVGYMLKCLAFLQAVYDCQIRAIHVTGVNNPVADALSRTRASSGLIKHSQVSPIPTQIPPAWVNLICQQALDWSSEHWKAMFRAFWRQASQNQP